MLLLWSSHPLMREQDGAQGGGHSNSELWHAAQRHDGVCSTRGAWGVLLNIAAGLLATRAVDADMKLIVCMDSICATSTSELPASNSPAGKEECWWRPKQQKPTQQMQRQG